MNTKVQRTSLAPGDDVALIDVIRGKSVELRKDAISLPGQRILVLRDLEHKVDQLDALARKGKGMRLAETKVDGVAYFVYSVDGDPDEIIALMT
jgi:hypothetical protein